MITKRNLKRLSVFLIIIVIVTFSLLSCQSKQYADKGDRRKIEFIRKFYQTIISSDYLTAGKATCIGQEVIRKHPKTWGMGEEEIENMRRLFPWNGLNLVQVTEIALNYYELKFEGKSRIKMYDLAIDQKNGSLCIHLKL